MNRVDVEQEIARALQARKGAVLNRNALNALFGAFSDPVGALGKIFLGRADAVDAEKARIEQGYILDLLCTIDEALKNMQASAADRGIVIDGLIETTVENAVDVVGVHIASDATNVRIQAGTHVKTQVVQAEKVTGFKVGGS